MLVFINDGKSNYRSESKIELSKIVDWCSIIFTKNGTIIDNLNKYATIKVNGKASINT